MKDFKIILDTSSDFTIERAEEYDIGLIPYYITLGENTYQDLFELPSHTFYSEMKNHTHISTGIPSPHDVHKVLDQSLLEGYKKFLFFTSSHKVTGMSNLLEIIKKERQDITIEIYDTLGVGMQICLQALHAIDLRDKGEKLENIVHYLRTHRHNAHVFALFRTLKYLIQGGRLSGWKGTIGQLLNIQPLLEMKDGMVHIKERIRGKKKSLIRLVEETQKLLSGHTNYYIGIFSGDNTEEKSLLKEMLHNEIIHSKRYIETDLTSVLGVHGGPEAIGVGTYIIE